MDEHNPDVDARSDTMTYVALPHPLPEPWLSKLKMCKTVREIDAIESEMRAAIGIPVNRPVARSVRTALWAKRRGIDL